MNRGTPLQLEGPEWTFNDGGRVEAGFKGFTGDCVTRAIAIATGKPYREVYDTLFNRSRALMAKTRPNTKLGRAFAKYGPTPRNGMWKQVYEPYLEELGWVWVPTMQIGTGTTVHLKADELPSGMIIARLSKHVCAVKDGVVLDTYDPSRDGTRAVYGYYTKGN